MLFRFILNKPKCLSYAWKRDKSVNYKKTLVVILLVGMNYNTGVGFG